MLIYRVAALKARGKRAPLEAAMTKLYASESFLQNSIDLVRIYGGKGYVKEGGVEQYVRDALGGLFASGTNDVQRNIIARLVGLRGGDRAPVRPAERKQTVP
jgi:alkylation response protein AidB-like acyl-CoA dehydrogenase